jgi:hypothetical protein
VGCDTVQWYGRIPTFWRTLNCLCLQSEDEGNKVLSNSGILHHYMMSQLRKPQLEFSSMRKSQVLHINHDVDLLGERMNTIKRAMLVRTFI